MKNTTIILLLIILIGCDETTQKGYKIIDTGQFEIEVPVNWKYKKEQGIDSFIGSIVGKGVDISFDWSEMGYANHLIPNEKEYLYEHKYDWMPIAPYAKKGITYTSGNVKSEREKIMKKEGITDTALVKVEEIQIPKEKIIKIKNEYKVILEYRDTVINVDINIPKETKNHIIMVDTIDNYKRKIIKPKIGVEGMTGIYFEDLNSDFNFNLSSMNLSINNQEEVIKAFKTIKIKRQTKHNNK